MKYFVNDSYIYIYIYRLDIYSLYIIFLIKIIYNGEQHNGHYGTVLFEQKFIHDNSFLGHIEDICMKNEHQCKGYGKND
jgi:hypothetical protein